jgi:hypothetical protein
LVLVLGKLKKITFVDQFNFNTLPIWLWSFIMCGNVVDAVWNVVANVDFQILDFVLNWP